MKFYFKALLWLLILVSISIFVKEVFYSGRESNKRSEKSEFAIIKSGEINGISYEMIELREFYMRYVTSDIIDETFADSLFSLIPFERILYFNTPLKPNRSEEYASYTDNNLFISYEPDSSEFIGTYEDHLVRSNKASNYFPENEEMQGRAFIISQDFVKRHLTNPKSADFPFLDYNVHTVAENTYRVSSYVDAKNAFGSEVRHNYVAILKHNGGEWEDINNWSLVDIAFD